MISLHLLTAEECSELDGITNTQDLDLTANNNDEKTWKVLAGSGKIFRAYAEPYVVVKAAIKSSDVPVFTEMTVVVSEASEVLVSLLGPGDEVTKMPVNDCFSLCFYKI